MFNIIFFLIILYFIYNYFINNKNNKNNIVGGNNKEIKITNLDNCIDEVMRLSELNKICDGDNEFEKAIEFCQYIDFDNEKDVKKLRQNINNGLFYKIKQNELKKCPKEPWVTTQQQCHDAINIKLKQGLVCKNDKYYKLGITTCKKANVKQLYSMGEKDGLLYKLRDRIYKKKIPTCFNKISSCINLTEKQCKDSNFENRCKYDIDKCKPWFFNNYDESVEFLKTTKIPKKQKKTILDLVYNEDLDKANYFAEIYIQKFAKTSFPKTRNCKKQVKYLTQIKNLKPEQEKSFKDLCKTKKGKNQVNSMMSSVIKN